MHMHSLPIYSGEYEGIILLEIDLSILAHTSIYLFFSTTEDVHGHKLTMQLDR
jgi:hypothetical protein